MRKTNLQSAFLGPTTNSEKGNVVQISGTETAPARNVFAFSGWPETIEFPAGATEVDELITKYEDSEDRKQALEDARLWFSDQIGKEEGNTLRVIRLRKGLSQARLADLIGTKQSHIARIEMGRCDPQVTTVQRLAEALGIDPVEVFQALTK